MPWEETTAMKLREEFVLRAKEPDACMAELCREYGISRKTGYKWVNRFDEGGIAALTDMSRRPHSCPVSTSGEMVLRVLELRSRHQRWGPKKLRQVLLRSSETDEVPSVRTIARILDRADVVRRRKRRPKATPGAAPLAEVEACHDLWTVDFKGWWRTRDGQRAEPLTVRDAFSRYILGCTLMTSTAVAPVREVFERLFELHGLPRAIQVDNGSPFACTRSPGGLTKLSAWWVSLGIRVVRGRPGHPQDNGAHERMHLDMALEVEVDPEQDLEAQQVALNVWQLEYNHVRPHEALEQRTPFSVFRRSTRPYKGPRRPLYPPGWTTRRVNKKGSIKYGGKSRYVSAALAGQLIGVRDRDDGRLDVLFYDLDLSPVGKAA